MKNDPYQLSLLQKAAEVLAAGFEDLPAADVPLDMDRLQEVLLEVASKLQDNYPYHHPLYAGQMLKPPHPIARLSYALAMILNPNNHALDGGRASSAMEKESAKALAAMFGWQDSLGHLCGGGTMANLEALWIANQLLPGKKIVASDQAHYTHRRISQVLKIPFESIPSNERAQMRLDLLENALARGDVGTVVATLGATATGAVDDLAQINDLRSKYPFRLHVDAAYGGYFRLVENLKPRTRLAFETIREADSIAIDPHKHGLQPYGCGCILFKDASVGRFYKHDSPYTYFTSNDLHLGEISLECSRPGASAVALWATLRLFPLTPGGEFSQGLAASRQAAITLFNKLEQDELFIVPFEPELDIVIWALKAQDCAGISRLSRELFKEAAAQNLHLALVELPASYFKSKYPHIEWDQESVVCLRSCLMKAEHLAWIEQIWSIIKSSSEKIRP